MTPGTSWRTTVRPVLAACALLVSSAALAAGTPPAGDPLPIASLVPTLVVALAFLGLG